MSYLKKRYRHIGVKPQYFGRIDLDHPHMHGITGWWPFYEGNGAPEDVVGGFNTENLNSPLWSVENGEYLSPALEYDQGPEITRVINSSGTGHPLDLVKGPLTWQAWFLAESNIGTIWSKRDGNSSQYQLYINQNTLIFRTGSIINDPPAVTVQTLYMAAVTFNSNGDIRYYLNGVEPTDYTSETFTFSHKDVSVSFGARWGGEPSNNFPFDGHIFDIRVYNNRELRADEIKEIYDNPYSSVVIRPRTYFLPSEPPTGNTVLLSKGQINVTGQIPTAQTSPRERRESLSNQSKRQ